MSETATSIESTEHQASPLGSIGIDSQFLIAQIINFALLLILLRWLLYRPIIAMLEKRSKTIADGLEMASQAKIQADNTQEEATKIINQAKDEAKEIIENARQTAEKLSTDIREKARQETERLVKDTQESLDSEKANIITQAQEQLAALIVKSTTKILADQNIAISEKEATVAIAKFKEQP